jgi:hypothetical protein
MSKTKGSEILKTARQVGLIELRFFFLKADFSKGVAAPGPRPSRAQQYSNQKVIPNFKKTQNKFECLSFCDCPLKCGRCCARDGRGPPRALQCPNRTPFPHCKKT